MHKKEGADFCSFFIYLFDFYISCGRERDLRPRLQQVQRV